MEKENSSRLGYLDHIRVFATFLVIILHSIYIYFNNETNFGKPLWYILGYVNELTRTGVPLFFMISGYLMLRRDVTNIAEFYKKRFLKIAVPFILYDIFYYFAGTANRGKTPSFSHFFSDLLNSGSEYHLWFVYSILFMYLLVPFLRRLVVSCSEKQLWLLLALATFQTTTRAFCNLLLDDTQFRIYFTSDGFAGYVGYVLLGYILGAYCNGRLTRRIIYAAGALFFIATPAVSMSLARQGEEMILTGGYAINHYAEAAALFLWCKNHVRGEGRVIGTLSAVSFNAYLIHVFILEAMRSMYIELPPSIVMTLYVVVTSLLSFLWGGIVRLASLCISMLLGKIRSKRAKGGNI